MFFARPTLSFALLLLLLGGVVTKANGLRINNADELIDFSNNVNKGTSYSGTTIYLDSDIDFTPSLSQQFEPIGNTPSYSFKGTFDGQGHTIKNLTLSLSSSFVGLFGYSVNAITKNVVLDDSCSFTSSYSSSTSDVGSICGRCESCVIESVVNMASVTYIGSASDNFCASGIIGRFLGTSTIRNCVNYGPVTYSGTSTNDAQIGGIAGMCGGEIKPIQNCANYGTITNNGELEKLYMGGIVGENFHGTVVIENCVSAGKIVNLKQGSASNYIGSVVGSIPSENNPQTTITHCLWTSDVGYNSVYGYNETTVTVMDSSLKELTKETVDDLNEYVEKNSTWSKWLLNTNNSTIHFKVNDYKGFNTSNKVILLPDLADTGNSTFKGWFTDSGYLTPLPSYEVSVGMALYGLYGVVAIVSFDGNGGTPSQQSKDVLFNKTYGALPETTRIGHTFCGWFTEKDEGEGERVTEEDIVDIGSDHTLYAQWSINNYTITFIFNNGKENEVRTLNFNESIVYPEDLTREGYIFNGWSPKPEAMPAGDITVTAQWIEKPVESEESSSESGKSQSEHEESSSKPESPSSEPDKSSSRSEESLEPKMPSDSEIPSGFIEIVFGKKDMKEGEIREIIKEYTDEEFTIEKIETDENTGGTRVIIKLADGETAQQVLEIFRVASEDNRKFKVVRIEMAESPNSGSLSSRFSPKILIFYLHLF